MKTILYFSPIAYDDLKQRPQYIAEGLSEDFEVYYIEPTVRLTSCILYGGNKYRGRVREVTKQLKIVRCNGLFVLPFHWNVYDKWAINGIYERIQLNKYIKKADCIIVAFEGWMSVLAHVKNRNIIYDKMDDNTLMSHKKTLKKYLSEAEKRLIDKISYMTVTAELFYNNYRNKVANIELIPNGIKFENCESNSLQLGTRRASEKRVFGYVGMISRWIDMDAIEKIAQFEDIEVVLVGPCEIEKSSLSNITYIGKVEKKEVKEWIESFDVCLYPFKQQELLDTINPVKVYEYLALNKPVIAVDSVEIRKFGNRVQRYRNYNELCELCTKDLIKPFASTDELNEFILENTWESRVLQFKKIVEVI